MPGKDVPQKLVKTRIAVAKPSTPPKRLQIGGAPKTAVPAKTSEPLPARPVLQGQPKQTQTRQPAPPASPTIKPKPGLVAQPPPATPVPKAKVETSAFPTAGGVQKPAALPVMPAAPPSNPRPVGAFVPAGMTPIKGTPPADPQIISLSLKEAESEDEAPPPISQQEIASRQKTETGKLQKPGAQTVISAKPVQMSAIIDAENEKVREILQNYLEICDSAMHEWTPVSMIDILHVFVRSLGMDVVSLALVDTEEPGKLMPVVSRGYNTPPTADIHAIWEKCIMPEANSVNWSRLMGSTTTPETPLACWILHENLNKFGYAPIHDGSGICGFLVTGMHGKGMPVSPFASTLLEMLGGRLGLSLSLRRTSKGGWPKSLVEKAGILRDQLSILLGAVEMLKEANKLSQEEVASLTGSCLLAISESTSLLDRMTEEAEGSM